MIGVKKGTCGVLSRSIQIRRGCESEATFSVGCLVLLLGARIALKSIMFAEHIHSGHRGIRAGPGPLFHKEIADDSFAASGESARATSMTRGRPLPDWLTLPLRLGPALAS